MWQRWKPLNMPIWEAKIIPQNWKFLQFAVLHLSALQGFDQGQFPNISFPCSGGFGGLLESWNVQCTFMEGVTEHDHSISHFFFSWFSSFPVWNRAPLFLNPSFSTFLRAAWVELQSLKDSCPPHNLRCQGSGHGLQRGRLRKTRGGCNCLFLETTCTEGGDKVCSSVGPRLAAGQPFPVLEAPELKAFCDSGNEFSRLLAEMFWKSHYSAIGDTISCDAPFLRHRLQRQVFFSVMPPPLVRSVLECDRPFLRKEVEV